ncbi:CARDB domain-containing protein [Streptomyces sp. NBC_01197]|uniref:CARDB domain-containing protein n=1 Tax=Streptomyces sp. NBC_01197 TaxID=2903768 RepID=UPI002E1187EB|nr:discoidin domain-containing protein [Streptomyces sp. NBC_01197]
MTGPHLRWRATAALATAVLATIGLPGHAPAAAAASNPVTSHADLAHGHERTTSRRWVQTDLGATRRIAEAVLRLPDGGHTTSRLLRVQGSTNGHDFTDLSDPQVHRFTTGNMHRATIPLGVTATRYVRVQSATTAGKPAGQLPQLEVYGPAKGDNSPPTAPAGVVLGHNSSGSATVSWKEAHDDNGVTAYDVYANGRLRTSLPATARSYVDQTPARGKVTYFVRARDAVGNQSADSKTLTRAKPSGDTQRPIAPASPALTPRAHGEVALSWQASTDNAKVTGYDVYANGKRLASTGADRTSYLLTPQAHKTVAYAVRAKDAAGNVSPPSPAVTRSGSADAATNLAVGKPVSASSVQQTYVAANADDDNTGTYWEGAPGSYPNALTVKLGANADTSAVVVKLNPDGVWSARSQTIEVLGREQGASSLSTLVAAKDYAFDPASGNSVTIPVSARVADVQLKFTANTGATGGQVAEFQVLGTPAPNPDLEITGLTAAPQSPVESDAITLSATVHNRGSAAAAATGVAFQLGGTKVATTAVGALAAGASQTVSAGIGTLSAGSYPLSGVVDPDNKVIEENEGNNTYNSPTPLVVRPVDTSDLVASPVSWTPAAPAAGDGVTFSVAVKNQGTVASASGSHGITLTLTDANGSVVKTFTGSYGGSIATGATTTPVSLGSWTAANGKYTVKCVIADDADEIPGKRANNTSSQPLFIGRGADMPYDMYEAEDGVLAGGAKTVGPNRTIGDLAGEASGRKAVTLNDTGASVEFTTKADANTLVTRFSMPDSAGGGGTSDTLDVYVDGTFLKAIDLTSKYAWLYGSESGPGNSPSAGPARHIYDEANIQLGRTVPKGSRIKLQKDAANGSKYAIDFVSLEQAAQIPDLDPAAYAVPTGFTQEDVQNALDRVRMDTTGKLVGVYLPAGDYQTSSKFQVYGKAVKILGAGPWFTRFHTPADQENTDAGFRADNTANGSTFANFSFFGNYTSRIDGPGKVFDFSNVAGMTIDNIWNEHTVCFYWGANTDNMTIRNSRIRDTFADGVNMTNGSTDNHVVNNEARATGDDSFALFSAIDAGGADEKNNVYENLTTLLTWRAAGVAVYGGFNNTFRNIRIADTLVYSGITISSLDFGYPMNGFGTDPTTFENITVDRAGGHFWNGQTFPGIWLFSASKVFQGIRVSNVDILDPTYSGIMFQTNYAGGQPQFPIKDTVLDDVSISGAHKSGDEFDAKSGFGLWANEMPEAGQGPAVGEVTFNCLNLSDNAQDIKNTTTTFKIIRNPCGS